MCGGEKKRGKKRKKIRKWYVCGGEKMREKKGKWKKEILLQYFHNTFTINLKWYVIIS